MWSLMMSQITARLEKVMSLPDNSAMGSSSMLVPGMMLSTASAYTMTSTVKVETMYGMYRRRPVGATIASSMNNVDSVVASNAVELRDSEMHAIDSAMHGKAIHHFFPS